MKRALLCEDDPISSTFLSDALDALGWRVEAFAFGQAAATAAIERRFDVLLLDLNLPDIDGLQLLRTVRNHDQHASADSPALVLTADDRFELHQQLRRQGFDAVLAKPVSLENLRGALATLVDDAAPVVAEVAPRQPMTALPIWDDAAALRALGGRHQTVQAMRALMLAELPAQCEQILREPDSPASHALLHRLRAACGFVGAARLAQAVIELEDTHSPTQRLLACTAFGTAVDELLKTPYASPT
jgi:CheY-like chemotaxis protein